MESALKPLQEILQRGQDEADFTDFDTRTGSALSVITCLH